MNEYSFWAIAIASLLVLVLTPIIVLVRRNRTEPAERVAGVVYVTQILGVLTAGAAILTLISAVAPFQRRTAVAVEAPIGSFLPWSLPPSPGSESSESYVMSAKFTVIELTVAQADLGTKILQALGILLAALPALTIGIVVVLLCERIIRRSPFVATLARMSWIGAGVLFVAGFAAQIVSGLASFRLAEIAFDLIRNENPGATLPAPAWPLDFDLWPLWSALALGILAVLLTHGIRLQRDTEGLV